MSNALVPFAPMKRDTAAPRSASRANSGFVAHLIATASQAPQTRARRRAEPEEAVAVYGGIGQRPSLTGRVLSRSL